MLISSTCHSRARGYPGSSRRGGPMCPPSPWIPYRFRGYDEPRWHLHRADFLRAGIFEGGTEDTKARKLSLVLPALRVLRRELFFSNFAFFAPFAVYCPIPNLSFGCGSAALGHSWRKYPRSGHAINGRFVASAMLRLSTYKPKAKNLAIGLQPPLVGICRRSSNSI